MAVRTFTRCRRWSLCCSHSGTVISGRSHTRLTSTNTVAGAPHRMHRGGNGSHTFPSRKWSTTSVMIALRVCGSRPGPLGPRPLAPRRGEQVDLRHHLLLVLRLHRYLDLIPAILRRRCVLEPLVLQPVLRLDVPRGHLDGDLGAVRDR